MLQPTTTFMASQTQSMRSTLKSSMPSIGRVTMIKDLNLARRNETIKVKVVRLWKMSMYNRPNEISSIEMIMVDEEGTRIQANVLKRWFDPFEQIFQEGGCYFIYKATIGVNNKPQYKYVLNENKLGMFCDTKVFPCTDWSGPEYGFSFSPFKPIIDYTLTEHHPLDVIGFITDVKPLQMFNSSNKKDTRKVNVIIKDLEMKSITVSLWNEYADRVISHWKQKDGHSIKVLILQFGQIRNWKNISSVNSAFEVSKLFLDDDIEEINDFRNSLLTLSATSACSTQHSNFSGAFLSLFDDFLVKTEFMNIAEVNISQVKSVIIVGTIRIIPVESPWYYMSCKKCNHKLIREEKASHLFHSSEPVDGYVCQNLDCLKSVIEPILRFKITLIVQDETGSISLTLFDRDASTILGQSATEMVEYYNNLSSKPLIPDELKALEEKKFAFKIEITSYNVKHRNWDFGISKLTDDEQIIAELEAKSNNGLLGDNNSVNQFEHGDMDESQETVSLKESIESIQDNSTPIQSSVDKSVGKRPVEEKPGLKRRSKNPKFSCNLLDSLNEEEVTVLSATKPPQSEAGKHTLLIPKIEK